MKINNKGVFGRIAWRCAGVIVLVGFVAQARGTILTFDESRDGPVGNPILPTGSTADLDSDYGDRVPGSPHTLPDGQFTYGNGGEGFTPNVVVDFFDASSTGISDISLWRDQYGDLINVAFANNNSFTFSIRLTADPGFNVLLYHFDLGGWPDTDRTIKEVRVSDGSTSLFSQTNVLVQGDFVGPRHTPFDFATPLSGSQLLIEIDYSNLPGGGHDNIGIDNIRFGQDPPPPIPEPASMGLFLGLGLLMMLRRLTHQH